MFFGVLYLVVYFYGWVVGYWDYYGGDYFVSDFIIVIVFNKSRCKSEYRVGISKFVKI